MLTFTHQTDENVDKAWLEVNLFVCQNENGGNISCNNGDGVRQYYEGLELDNKDEEWGAQLQSKFQLMKEFEKNKNRVFVCVLVSFIDCLAKYCIKK